MATRRWRVAYIAVALSLGLVGTACSTSTQTDPGPADPAPVEGAVGIDTPAAGLTQTLTDLLDSHVFLAGIAVEQAALTKDPGSAQFTAAAEALDQNSQDLAAAIESVYGADAGQQFLELWRAHIGFFVDYTVGGIGGDEEAQDAAKAELDQYRADFGAFIDSATGGNLPADDVAAALQMHVDSLIGTIDLVLSGEGNPFLSLYASAHEHMPGTATALAGGIASSQNIEGSVDSPQAALQQTLTDLLNSHVFLAGIAVEQAALTKDPGSAQFTAAAEALDQNSQDLAAAIESVYGADAGQQFLELWRAHIGFFVDYTVGGIGGDEEAQDAAKAELDQYRADFGAFIDSATGGNLPADDVAAALQMHVDSLIGTIDLVLSGEGNPFLSLYASAHEHMPGTATALAGGIIAANPETFAA